MGSGSSVQRSQSGGGGGKADHSAKAAAGGAAGQNSVPNAAAAVPQLDKQLPFANYREWYNMKNFWKTIQRNKEYCAKTMLFTYLTDHQQCQTAYTKLARVDLADREAAFNDSDFENLAVRYLDVFDEAIQGIESNPSDVSSVVQDLIQVGKVHKKVAGMQSSAFAKLQQAFICMARDVLQDRFSEKCEQSFEKFFSFVEKNLSAGFDGSS